MMERPSSLTRLRTFHNRRLVTGSIPLEGSSKNTTGGDPIKAMAVLILRLLPPLKQ